jgi:hypothetical protein
LTTKGLCKGLKTAFKGLFLVNPMHPTWWGLQGLKTGKKKPALGGSRLMVADFMSQGVVLLGIVLQGQSKSMLH